MSQISIPNFNKFEHTHNKHTCTVYHGGIDGSPLVFLLHEIPNPTPEVFELARKLIKEGYHVHLPVFFGRTNEPYSLPNAISKLVLSCIHREFSVFAKDATSPIVDWLRSLCKERMKTTGQTRDSVEGRL